MKKNGFFDELPDPGVDDMMQLLQKKQEAFESSKNMFENTVLDKLNSLEENINKLSKELEIIKQIISGKQ